jgi:glycosyltransferase involved in cell wall biosynthesis
MGEEPVSVVIPLHNGVATLERTLESVCAQTWRTLDIIVVDDGSTDGSGALVEALAARDPRVRLVRQANAGVAAARNRGAKAAKSDWLAFVDADDLWAPEKIALQMQAMRQGGDRVGLVYTWAALIDEQDRIYSLDQRPDFEGAVFADLCRGNIVGNGSSTLMRREAFERAGGYDPALRAQGAQGCEDLQIYLRIAEHYEFLVVKRFLTGYRVTRGNMSSDAARMLRSCELVLGEFRARFPHYRRLFDAHQRHTVVWLMVRALTTGPWRNALFLATRLTPGSLWELAGKAPWLIGLTLKAHAPNWIKRPVQKLAKRGGEYRPFYQAVAP